MAAFGAAIRRGFGTTVGNSLRRALLSSIEGAAITAVKIEGVEHEFSSIKGVVEDATDVILNLKQVPFKLHSRAQDAAHQQGRGRRSYGGGYRRLMPTSRFSIRACTSLPSVTVDRCELRCA